MSTPDDPTRRVPEVREREVVEQDPWRAEVTDQLRMLRNALWGLALLAALAVGLSVWAIVVAGDDDDDGTNRNASSQAQVGDLEERVDRLDSQLGEVPGRDALNKLENAQSRMSERLDQLEEQAGEDDDSGLEQSIDDLSSQLDELSARVDQVEQEQEQQAEQTP